MLVLLQKLALHLQEKKPFVSYRKPGENKVNTLLQQTDDCFTTTDFSEQGFVFAPFLSEKPALYIPTSDSEVIETVFEPKKTDANFLNQNNETDLIAKNHHLKLVEKGLKAIESGKLQKVVLTRKHSVEFPEQGPWMIFERLLENYPEAFVYVWFHPDSGLWMGATPEKLLQVKANHLTTMSLAGTQKNTGVNVIWKQKEKLEQAIVTDFIVEQLSPKLENILISETKSFAAGKLWHLKTDISGKVLENNLREIVDALHPTPAVCGFPRIAAKEFILQNEDFDREFYTGFLGELNIISRKERARNERNQENKAYVSLKPVTDLYVNLRCMKIENEKALLFAGGGITADSNPESEWEETLHKIQTMLNVL